MKSTLSPRALWAVAAVLAVVAAVRVAGASDADAAAELRCGPGAVVVHVGTKGDGIPLPMAVATAAPRQAVADVARLNRLEVTATLPANPLGQNCLTVAGRTPAKSAAAAPGK